MSSANDNNTKTDREANRKKFLDNFHQMSAINAYEEESKKHRTKEDHAYIMEALNNVKNIVRSNISMYTIKK